MPESKTPPGYVFALDCAKPFTFWEKIKLLFRGQKYMSDKTSYIVYRNINGVLYIVGEGEFK